jgi:hypothetical protein
MALYEKPVRQLMRDMVKELGLQPEQVIDRETIRNWFKTHYPLVTEGTVSGHLVRMSANVPARVHHTLKADGSDDLFFKLDARRFRLYDPKTDPAPITTTAPIAEEVSTESVSDYDAGDASRFAYEHDLRDYLAKNLQLIEPGLKLYSEEGITGIEFPVGGRNIDILAVDQAGAYVVIELKVSKGHERVIGQLLRYIGWIEEHHAAPGQSVRGIIVAKEISDDIRLACRRIAGVQLFEYALSVSVKRKREFLRTLSASD